MTLQKKFHQILFIIIQLSINLKKYYGYKKIFYGTKYFFSNSILKDFYRRDIKNILVFFGGSDIKNFSQKVMLNLKKLQVKNKITLVLGPGN